MTLTCHDITEILLKVVLNTITLSLKYGCEKKIEMRNQFGPIPNKKKSPFSQFWSQEKQQKIKQGKIQNVSVHTRNRKTFPS